ncbi:hypothetical protein BpHYR1_026380 [Brachionus plicatilis]|uniref:Uncharacterized protein n=1 Tax=Brachionus plicatilis TaxID=10195 RepID=A0A3M7SVC8_BRAPC|nr:hypothetical protein BpHYR1_026380 [Brachionus plicatilis]
MIFEYFGLNKCDKVQSFFEKILKPRFMFLNRYMTFCVLLGSILKDAYKPILEESIKDLNQLNFDHLIMIMNFKLPKFSNENKYITSNY